MCTQTHFIICSWDNGVKLVAKTHHQPVLSIPLAPTPTSNNQPPQQQPLLVGGFNPYAKCKLINQSSPSIGGNIECLKPPTKLMSFMRTMICWWHYHPHRCTAIGSRHHEKGIRFVGELQIVGQRALGQPPRIILAAGGGAEWGDITGGFPKHAESLGKMKFSPIDWV